ncbi:hypothetical protein AOLI_G00153570 [Acnodon oligacanthus]
MIHGETRKTDRRRETYPEEVYRSGSQTSTQDSKAVHIFGPARALQYLEVSHTLFENRSTCCASRSSADSADAFKVSQSLRDTEQSCPARRNHPRSRMWKQPSVKPITQLSDRHAAGRTPSSARPRAPIIIVINSLLSRDSGSK